jgi:hypothetical protein
MKATAKPLAGLNQPDPEQGRAGTGFALSMSPYPGRHPWFDVMATGIR